MVTLSQLGLASAQLFHLPGSTQSSTVSSLERNLIVNGDAETSSGSIDGSVVAVSGWNVSGNFTVVKYGAVTSGGNLPSPTDPGPPNRGTNLFAGGPGPNNDSSHASQTIDITSDAALIDTGRIYYVFTGYLGGWEAQGDKTKVTALFQDANNVQLGAPASIGPVSNIDRGNKTGLHLRHTIGALPVGARKIIVQIETTRTDSNYNDGYADNLSLMLTAVVSQVYLPLMIRNY